MADAPPAIEATLADLAVGLVDVPEHLHRGLTGHVVEGLPVGDFLFACLSNDLRGAVRRADDQSFAGLKGIVRFLYHFAPADSWGSRAAVDAWRTQGGLIRKANL